MQQDDNRLYIFVGSPGDVGAERAKAFEVIDKVAQDPGLRDRCRIETVGWDRSPYARDARVSPQRAIDLGLLAPGDCDIAVFIFSQRIGTELSPEDYPESYGFDSLTGSLWEYYNARQAADSAGWPALLVFHSAQKLAENPNLKDDEEELLAQRLGVIRFIKREFQDTEGRHTRDYFVYDNLRGFADDLERQLREHLHRRLAESPDRLTDPSDVTPEKDDRWRNTYLDWVRRNEERVESVLLLGLEVKKRSRVRLPQIYVPALTASPQRLREAADDSSPRERLAQETAPSLEPVLHRLGRESLYLPGAPGAGKTFFCRWLRWLIARGEVPEHRIADPTDYAEAIPASLQHYLPVLVTLRDFAALLESRDADRWLANQLVSALRDWLDRRRPGGLDGERFGRALERGQILLILDGVDELPEYVEHHGRRRYPRTALVTGLADALPDWHANGNRILLTSRPYGLNADQSAAIGLPEAGLADLPDELQTVFVRRWFDAVEPDKGDRLSADFWGEVGLQRDQNRELQEWLANPLLLTALCAKFDDGNRLPRDIHELYDGIIDRVLYNRCHAQVDEVEDYRRRLAVIALGMHRGGAGSPWRSSPVAAVSTAEVDRILADYKEQNQYSEAGGFEAARSRDQVLSRSGLLVPAGSDKAEFLHLSFQEFLAAERLDSLRESIPDLLAQFAGEPGWRRTLRFLFARVMKGNLDRAVADFRCLEEHLTASSLAGNPDRARLWGECLELLHAKGKLQPALGETFQAACLAALEAADDPEAREALFCNLDHIGWDRRTGVGLTAAGMPNIDWLPVPGAEKTDFYISRHLITNEQYQAFVSAGGYEDWARWLGIDGIDNPDYEESTWREDNHPKTDVSWYEATAFCRWLTAQGITAEPGGETALPTDSEWLAAYVGDSGWDYPWHAGEYQPGRANCLESGEEGGLFLQRTTAVGLYPGGVARSGALDMAGNVWEWCADKYDQLGTTEPDDSRALRVLRGGSWDLNPGNLRSSYRLRYFPDYRYDFIGFRVVCRPPSSAVDY